MPLRVTLLRPPAGVRFCLQGKEDELVSPAESDGGDLAFDLAVRAKADAAGEGLRFGGPFVRGPAGAKFVYVCSGTMAGQAGTCWSRRATVPLGGITPDLVRKVAGRAGKRLQATIAGTAGDGGPACATVPLVGGGWKVVGE